MNTGLKGLKIAGIIATIIIAAPLIAEATHPGLSGGTITLQKDDVKEILFLATGAVPTGTGAYGYGVLTTNNDFIAVTSHKGVFDSTSQTHPVAGTTVDLCSPALIAAGHCSGIWHSHLSNAGGQPACVSGVEITRLTHQEPSQTVTVSGSTVSVETIDRGTQKYTESLTGTQQNFKLGVIDNVQTVAFFELTVEFDGAGNPHVCVNALDNSAPATITRVK